MSAWISRPLPEEALAEVLAAIKSTVSHFPGAFPKQKPNKFEPNIVVPSHHLDFLELHNQGIKLKSLLEESSRGPVVSVEAPLPFPKRLTSHFLDARYTIFCYHNMLKLLPTEEMYASPPPNPCGQIVLVQVDGYVFLGLVGLELEPSIYRVFDLTKEFEYKLACPHHFSCFPVGTSALLNLTEGDRVFAIEIARKRFQARIVRGTFVRRIAETGCEIESNGEIFSFELRHVARSGSDYEFDQALEERYQNLVSDYVCDPTDVLDLKEHKKLIQSTRERTPKKRKPKQVLDEPPKVTRDETSTPIELTRPVVTDLPTGSGIDETQPETEAIPPAIEPIQQRNVQIPPLIEPVQQQIVQSPLEIEPIQQRNVQFQRVITPIRHRIVHIQPGNEPIRHRIVHIQPGNESVTAAMDLESSQVRITEAEISSSQLPKGSQQLDESVILPGQNEDGTQGTGVSETGPPYRERRDSENRGNTPYRI
jgi:hypothetical protein